MSQGKHFGFLRRPPPMWMAILITAVLVGLMVWMRLGLWRGEVLPVGFGMPLVLVAVLRNRRLLWISTFIFACITVHKFAYALPHANPNDPRMRPSITMVKGAIVLIDAACVALVADLWIQAVILLEARRRKAEEESLRKGRFLAAVSHDIRTPANAIGLLAELVKRAAESGDTTDLAETAGELQNSAVSMVTLIADVLDITRLDIGAIELRKSDFALGELLADCCRQLAPLATKKGLELSCDGPDPDLFIKADRIKLLRVFNNLVGNAIKFTDKGTVQVDAERLPEGRVQVAISDTGIGIAPEHHARIFDEYFQLKNPDRERMQSSGLGLSISKRLIETMGGTLQVASQFSQGSTFTVTLPAAIVVPTPAAKPS